MVPSRAEKKARTRNALMDAVLSIVGYGANFASISLREVAKHAGVVPTSFYRHFGDMEELGLAMVDELGLNLRRLMRGSFDPERPLDQVIGECVDVYHQYVLENANVVQFMNQSRTGGTQALQDAIRNELNFVRSRIASDLSLVLPDLKAGDRNVVAGLIVSTLLENTTTLLAIPPDKPALLDEHKELTKREIQLIMVGARTWQQSGA